MASTDPTDNHHPEARIALDKILEHSLEGIAIIRENKRIEYVNEALCIILGRPRDELLGEPFETFVHHESLSNIKKRYASRLSGESIPWTYEARVLHSDGEARDVRIRTSILTNGERSIRILAQVINMTEERRYQEALSEGEALYRTLVNTMNEGLGVIDDRGIFVQANPTLCRMLDYTEEELLGKTVSDIMAGLTRDEVFGKIKERIAGKSECYETQVVHRSGRLIPVMASASPLLKDASEYVGSVVVISNIAKEKATERQLWIARNRATLYLDLMRHDIRNHLQEVQVSAELLLLNNLNSSQSDLVEHILNAVSKSNATISTSGEMEALANLPMKERLLDEVIHESMKDASLLLDDVVISLSLHATDAKILADDFLELLVSDLLVNSFEYNPSDTKRVWVELEDEGDVYALSISDNGPGLPDRAKRKLFDPTSRIKGIGFHLAHHIVEKYGGVIEVLDRVEGDPHQGKKVRVAFPKRG